MKNKTTKRNKKIHKKLWSQLCVVQLHERPVRTDAVGTAALENRPPFPSTVQCHPLPCLLGFLLVWIVLVLCTLSTVSSCEHQSCRV